MPPFFIFLHSFSQMAHIPNAAAVTFCTWLEDNTWLRFSGSQLQLIGIVKQAGIDIVTVTDTQWKNFLNVTQSRWQLYLQAVELEV